MTRHELETKFASDQVGSDQHSRLSALVSISETLDSLLPLPVRILDDTTSGESWIATLIMTNIRIWIWGQSVPNFRFTRWCEIQAQIEDEYARTPEILNSPVESWQSINPDLCQLLYLQECRAVRHSNGNQIEGLDYTDPVSNLKRKTNQETKTTKQSRDTSAFD